MILSYAGFAVIGIGAIVAAILALRSHVHQARKDTLAAARNSGSSNKKPARKKNPYLATAIAGNDNMCAAARAINGKRFLVAENTIPQLPLPGCDAARCTCIYAHFADRRDADEMRRGPMGLHSEVHKFTGQMERRVKRGRRASDWE